MGLLQKRLEGHYDHMKNFIRTQAEPTIFFLPVKHSSKSEKCLEHTQLAIEQKIHSLKTHLQYVADSSQPAGSEDCEVVSSGGDEEDGRGNQGSGRHRRKAQAADGQDGSEEGEESSASSDERGKR